MSSQSASSASGEKSFTGLDFDPTSLPCPGTALSLADKLESASQLDSTVPLLHPPLPSPRFAVHGFDHLNGSCSGVQALIRLAMAEQPDWQAHQSTTADRVYDRWNASRRRRTLPNFTSSCSQAACPR